MAKRRQGFRKGAKVHTKTTAERAAWKQLELFDLRETSSRNPLADALRQQKRQEKRRREQPWRW
jgi:hypothetical protein